MNTYVALWNLVKLKELREDIERINDKEVRTVGDAEIIQRLQEEYDRRKPRAWQDARDALENVKRPPALPIRPGLLHDITMRYRKDGATLDKAAITHEEWGQIVLAIEDLQAQRLEFDQAHQKPAAYLKEWQVDGKPRRRVDLTTDCEPWLREFGPTITPLFPRPPAKPRCEVCNDSGVVQYDDSHGEARSAKCTCQTSQGRLRARLELRYPAQLGATRIAERTAFEEGFWFALESEDAIIEARCCRTHVTEWRTRKTLPCPWCTIDELKRNREAQQTASAVNEQLHSNLRNAARLILENATPAITKADSCLVHRQQLGTLRDALGDPRVGVALGPNAKDPSAAPQSSNQQLDSIRDHHAKALGVRAVDESVGMTHRAWFNIAHDDRAALLAYIDNLSVETKAEQPYHVRSFWSPDKRYLVSAHATPDGIVTLQDDNGREWEATGPSRDMSAPARSCLTTDPARIDAEQFPEARRYRMEASVHKAAPDDSEDYYATTDAVEALNGEWVKWDDVKALIRKFTEVKR